MVVFGLYDSNFIVAGLSNGTSSWYGNEIVDSENAIAQAYEFGAPDLAAVTSDDTMTLFYQANSGAIGVLTFTNDSRPSDSTIPTSSTETPNIVTGIAAVGWTGGHLRAYYQAMDGTLYEAAYDGQWVVKPLPVFTSVKDQTPIAAASKVDSAGVSHSLKHTNAY